MCFSCPWEVPLMLHTPSTRSWTRKITLRESSSWAHTCTTLPRSQWLQRSLLAGTNYEINLYHEFICLLLRLPAAETEQGKSFPNMLHFLQRFLASIYLLIFISTKRFYHKAATGHQHRIAFYAVSVPSPCSYILETLCHL
jgi:hypothetical protein